MNLNQVTVPCSSIDRSIEFYTKLGLRLIVHSTDNYARFLCPDGTSTFSIQKDDCINNTSTIKVYFECVNLDEKVNQLIAQGIEFTSLPKEQVWLWREAYLKDPDNNELVLYKAGENRVNPPWRIS